MAQQGSPRRFVIQLSNVDRGVYTGLDLRVSQQSSETDQFLLTRVFAYCCLTRDDADSALTFSKGGISTPEEPALSRTALDGRLLMWCEIGNPSAERLHKAGKSGASVVLFTHHEPERQVEELRSSHIHRKDALEVFSLDAEFLDAVLDDIDERGANFELTIAENTLYVVLSNGKSHSGNLRQWSLQ